MARKSRATESGLLMLLFLLLLSFAIASWFGKDLYTVIIAVLSLATLVMIGMLIWKRGRGTAFGRGAHAAKRKSSLSPRQKWGVALGLIGAGILVLLILMAGPPINWFRQNLHTIIPFVLSLAALAVIGGLVWIYRRNLVPKGIGVGEYLDKYTQKPRSMKDDTLASDVWQKIVDFRCKGHYEKERDFQHELYRWLEDKFRDKVKWEHKRGIARADISIGRIAIEIKGPTGNSQLREASRQIGPYRHDYDFIFFVLFKPKWNEPHFDIFIKTLSHFPYVGVITNSG